MGISYTLAPCSPHSQYTYVYIIYTYVYVCFVQTTQPLQTRFCAQRHSGVSPLSSLVAFQLHVEKWRDKEAEGKRREAGNGAAHKLPLSSCLVKLPSTLFAACLAPGRAYCSVLPPTIATLLSCLRCQLSGSHS